ncbi:hypothetical protein GGF46_005399 [Coemansia sp. RSA 552]|nr:hypothetical protein GGF46_005399 [Coemansia sp. RSA 552]
MKMTPDRRANSSMRSRANSNASSASKGSQSALDVYRDWLDEASSSDNESHSDKEGHSDNEGGARSGRPAMEIPRPVSPQDPVNRPRQISPCQQLHALPPDPSSPQPKSGKAAQPARSPPKRLRTPRKLMHQMSFRSILSPSPHPSSSRSDKRKDPVEKPARRSTRQASLGSLFSDAWIAQPPRIHKPLPKAARMDSRQTLYDIPLSTAGAAAKPRTLSESSSDTVNEKLGYTATTSNEKAQGGSAVDWEFHPVDGRRGWWVVGWSFLACFVSLSTLVNYPVYEAYYIKTSTDEGTLVDTGRGDEDLDHGGHLSAYVVLIGTLMSGFAALGSLGAGIASDVLGLRICALSGTVILCMGLIASSFIDRLWALCITQGVISGLGIALMALPAYMAPTFWFERHRALSSGIAIAGTGLGVVSLTPAYRAILRHRGMAVCLYVQTLITLVLGVASSLGLRPRVELRYAPTMHWRKVFTDLRVLTLMLMALFAAAARFAQLLSLPVLARAAGAEDDAAGVLYTMGASLLAGMIAGGAAADKTGYIAGIGLSELVLGIFTLALYTPSTTVAPMYVFAVVFGLTSGTLAAVLPGALAQMFGTKRLATTTGLVLVACAPAILATAPAAIKFLHLLEEGRSIAWLSAISGVFSVVAGILGMSLPVIQRRYIRMYTKRQSAVAWPPPPQPLPV